MSTIKYLLEMLHAVCHYLFSIFLGEVETYKIATDIPSYKFKEHATLYGRVEKVMDGDTLRIRHYPMYPFSQSNSYEGYISKNTISVRIYAVDAPETAKRGRPAMPFANEATYFLQSLVQGKIVAVKLLRKDQYRRVIGVVCPIHFCFFSGTDVSFALAKQGYATLYTQGGAQYDGKKTLFENEIHSAKNKKRGVWKNGSHEFVLPSEFKQSLKRKKT